MSSDYYIFTIVYFLISICLIYPPTEFVTAGLTIPSIFSSILGSEHEKCITYHMKKSCLNLLIYSLLPLGYLVSSYTLEYTETISQLAVSDTLFWKLFYTTSLVLPLLSFYEIYSWTRNDYSNHPIAVNIFKFCNDNMHWKSVANDIEMEYRRIDNLSIQTSPVVNIVATENWILKITPLTIFVVHQSDASLVVKEANTYHISPSSLVHTQFLNIEVKSRRQGVNPFVIRVNAGDFKDLADRVSRTITIMPNVKFHQSVLDQFVDVFKETIKCNPSYGTNQELEQCIGCLQTKPNVKIQKLCEDSPGQNNCASCYCKPMWCSDCLAKWFASRQDQEQQNRWLSSKCTCPMCRATFCLLDVCLVNELSDEE
ncbi:unnamed protein product [Phaedon cochleariae]|uniref:E3 ubiquitin-protein ligase TM129 n=1 Tax=Phaedon cochleariae TaxID=80249 RepID=A0A9P0DS85_PHACE|nr:unnamed protein product [Phaedon cochleariae]